jgi:hypothetical protein
VKRPPPGGLFVAGVQPSGDDLSMTEYMEHPEEEIIEVEEVEEHQGDLASLEDVKLRIDGVMYCRADKLQEITSKLAYAGKQVRADQQALIDSLLGSGEEEVPVVISRYVILDFNYNPAIITNTPKLVGDAVERINETLEDGREGKDNTERRWWWNSLMEGSALGELLGDNISDLKPTRFEASAFQVYNFTDQLRKAGIEETGDIG